MSLCPHCEQATSSGRASGHFKGHHFICDLTLTEENTRRLAERKYRLLRERHFKTHSTLSISPIDRCRVVFELGVVVGPSGIHDPNDVWDALRGLQFLCG